MTDRLAVLVTRRDTVPLRDDVLSLFAAVFQCVKAEIRLVPSETQPENPGLAMFDVFADQSP